MLTQAGSKDGKIVLEGFGSDYRSDPFAAFAGITQLTGSDSDIYGGPLDTDPDRDEDEDNSFRLFGDDDDSFSPFGGYKKTRAGQDLLDKYTKSFSNFF